MFKTKFEGFVIFVQSLYLCEVSIADCYFSGVSCWTNTQKFDAYEEDFM
jgi:hypothetical protein